MLGPQFYELGTPKIYGSLRFFHQVLMRFADAAGGTTGEHLVNGFNKLMFEGFEFVPVNVAPQSHSSNQYAAWFGAVDAGIKFGEVNGGTIGTTNDRYFEEDMWALRYTTRWAINCHDVTNAVDSDGISTSAIIGLKDG